MPVRKADTARGVFVAGTDTGVGKTLVACALLQGLAVSGLRAVGMKPVAAGAVRRAGGWHHEDVAQLQRAGNVEVTPAMMNPYCFEPAIAPHIAAQEAGVPIRMALIEQRYRQLARLADVIVVEGVGGLLVPLGRSLDAADIPLRLRLPVLLVVGLRLGCLNHALLTVAAVQARGLRLAGWVANHIDPAMARVEQNLQALQKRIQAPLLGEIACVRRPHPATLARLLDIRRLQAMI